MVLAEPFSSSERLLREDLAGGDFVAGQDRGYWTLEQVDFPSVLIRVAAATREGSPDSYLFRFDVSDYPNAPACQLWDADHDAPLPATGWPCGGRADQAFNPAWNPAAIYLPVDRVALEGHEVWAEQHPEYIWNSERDLTDYLNLLREILIEEGYTGARS